MYINIYIYILLDIDAYRYVYLYYIYTTYMCRLYLYVYKFKFTSKRHSQTLSHRRKGNNKGQETYLAQSAEYIINYIIIR